MREMINHKGRKCAAVSLFPGIEREESIWEKVSLVALFVVKGTVSISREDEKYTPDHEGGGVTSGRGFVQFFRRRKGRDGTVRRGGGGGERHGGFCIKWGEKKMRWGKGADGGGGLFDCPRVAKGTRRGECRLRETSSSKGRESRHPGPKEEKDAFYRGGWITEKKRWPPHRKTGGNG